MRQRFLQAGLSSGGPLESFAQSCQLQTARGEWGMVTADLKGAGDLGFGSSFLHWRLLELIAGLLTSDVLGGLGRWESFSAFVAMPATNV
jgi:hypothetical protein